MNKNYVVYAVNYIENTEGKKLNNEDIIKYVKHYIDKDISKGAIMLTGAWGSGKSYFIQNSLLDELQKDDKIKCVIVSLYGLKSVDEISKSIYFELRFGFMKTKSEATETSILAAKTIVKGVTSFLGIDLKASNNDISNLYKSVDLKGKLIVLEDLERCQIDIIDVLGFVNNLVDQDGVKVLLVANENEFLHYETIEVDKPNYLDTRMERVSANRPDKKTENYLKTKEKTINDTIIFEGNFNESLKNIIEQFNDEYLKEFAKDETIKEICSKMESCRCFNLRSFIYACQKTVDIFEQIPKEYLKDIEFVKAIYYGIIIYVCRIKSGRKLSWGAEKYFSIELGDQAAPLFKFCYEYIMKQTCNLTQIDDVYEAWKEKNRYDKNKSNGDNDIDIISDYSIHSEEEIVAAVKHLTNRLSNPDDISFYKYGTIAVYLILIEHLLECDIGTAKERLVQNLKGKGDKLQIEYVFRTIMSEDEDENILNEYHLLRKDMENALKRGILDIPNFSYLPEQTEKFCDYIYNHEDILYENHSFARELDILKMAKMFEECSLVDKDYIRLVFEHVYNSEKSEEFLRNDLDSIKELKNCIEKSAKNSKGDKIEKLQYELFLRKLTDIVEKLQ